MVIARVRKATLHGCIGLAFALGAGCSSRAAGLAAGEGDGGPSSSGDRDAASAADADTSCSQGCSGTADPGSLCAISADAQLVDPAGAPVVGANLLLCGLNICSFPVATDARGRAHFDLCLNMTSPALKFLGRASAVSFAVPMTAPTQAFPPVVVTPLPAQGSALPGDGGAGVSASGGVTLQVGAGTIAFDPTAPLDANADELRAAPVRLVDAPPGLDPAFGVKALWGLAPLNAKLAPPGTLTVPNPDPQGWPAGTQVDVVMNGLDESPDAAVAYGGWGRVSTGTVSADGATIVTTGLPILGLIGVGPHR